MKVVLVRCSSVTDEVTKHNPPPDTWAKMHTDTSLRTTKRKSDLLEISS